MRKKRTLLLLVALCISALLFFSIADNKIFEPSNMFKELNKEDKAAILMVHFGTTHADTRALTIDAINQKVAEVFPDVEVREAYTSRIVIKRLNDQGIKKLNPVDALNELKNYGYTHILIQPTTIINGVEMESLNRNVEELRDNFKDIRVGTPLLFYTNDYEEVVDILTQNNNPDIAYLWVGHGTYDVSTAQYAMLDYMFKDKGFKNHIVGCVEGYPYYEQALKQLKSLELKQVKLIPFMFVAGEHAKNDIAEDWKNELESEGFSVEVSMQGLGEIKEIKDKFVRSLQFCVENRRLDIMDKKRVYEITGEKMKR